MRLAFALACSVTLTGCVGSIAANIVTAPVKVAGKAIDVITYNQPPEASNTAGAKPARQPSQS